jgi:hypothetical protein
MRVAVGGYVNRMTTGDPSARESKPDTTDAREGDAVAWSRQIEDRARRLLASGGVDADASRAIEDALAQIEADRTNGESPRESTMRLERLLEDETD